MKARQFIQFAESAHKRSSQSQTSEVQSDSTPQSTEDSSLSTENLKQQHEAALDAVLLAAGMKTAMVCFNNF